MEKKAGSLRINSKKFGSMNKPCLKETITFLNCLALNNNKDDEKCVRQKDLLSACMNDQVSVDCGLWKVLISSEEKEFVGKRQLPPAEVKPDEKVATRLKYFN